MTTPWRRFLAIRTTWLAAMLVASGALLSACGGASMPASGGTAVEAPAVQPQTTAGPLEMAPGADGAAAPADGVSQSPQQAQQRLVIKNADLSLQVLNVEQAEAQLRAKVFELGGYVVSAETEGSGDGMSMRVSFRVPSARFDEAMGGVEGLAEKVMSRSISGEDVTEEYVDLESQLRNLQATRDRLLDLLEKATRVEDALQVNQAITDVQGQIEVIQGRMKYLQQSAALSTISVYLAPVPTTPLLEEDGWQPWNVARGALRDLLIFGQGLANVAIVLAIWTPLWLPLVLLGRWAWLRTRAQISAGTRPLSPPPAPPAPPTEA